MYPERMKMKKRLTQSLVLIVALAGLITQVSITKNVQRKELIERTKNLPYSYEDIMVPRNIKEMLTVTEQDVQIVAAQMEPEIPNPELLDTYISRGWSEEHFWTDVDMIAKMTMAEAEGESDLGKRYVIDVILNRVDGHRWPNDICGVLYDGGQFTSMDNGRYDNAYVDDHIKNLVVEELYSRTNYEVIYFKTDGYFSSHLDVIQVGNHFFSK